MAIRLGTTPLWVGSVFTQLGEEPISLLKIVFLSMKLNTTIYVVVNCVLIQGDVLITHPQVYHMNIGWVQLQSEWLMFIHN